MKWPALPFSPTLQRLTAPGAGLAGAAGESTATRHSGLLRHRALRAFALLAATACLLWPAILNSQPIFFYDTPGYLRGAIQAFHFAGIDSEWSALYNKDVNLPEGEDRAAAAGGESTLVDESMDGFVTAARSVYYGAVLYLGALAGSLWFGVLFQALAVALAVYLTLRAFFGRASEQLPYVLALLGIITPVSFFASYLMPDIFAGITILACAGLLALYDRLPGWAHMAWFALLTLSLLFHASFIAFAAALMPAGMLIVRATTGRFPWKGAGLVTAAIALGMLSQAVFYRAVEAVYGHPPLRPPFLMARVISDGPGYDYLRETCPDNGFKVCDFLPVLPLDTDEILWARDPDAGVVGPADPQTRRLLVEQQMPFVMEVLRHDLSGQLTASLSGFLEQLARFGIDEFAYLDSRRKTVLENLPPSRHDAFRNSLLYRDTFPLEPTNVLFHAAIAAAALFLIWGLPRLGSLSRQIPAGPRRLRSAYGKLVTFSLVVLSGVVANAAETGILSTPHDRYQARVVWLIPLLAILVLLCLRVRRRAVADKPAIE